MARARPPLHLQQRSHPAERPSGRRSSIPFKGLVFTAMISLCSAAQQPKPATSSPAQPKTTTNAAAQQPNATTNTSVPALQVPAQPQLTPQEQYAAQQHAQKVQDLINRAQASYRSGVNNYNNNQLEAARSDFDAAVDLLLSSGMDLKNDSQLSDELEHLLTAINSLEIVALKQGNGFSPKEEETPLDVASNEVTFAPDPALIGRVTAELKTTQSDLPLVVNEYVAGFISYFSNSSAGHAHLVRSLERAGKYHAMISRILNQYGVPQDLIYLAVAESGFQPQVLNRSSGAGGMWQFMPFAGAYGLTRNGYFDERFDPEKSTIAYAKYMKSLYNQFGDWYLAMAAYDWGPGYVQRAVQRTGYADFWQLYRLGVLPAETRNYVPGILAAAIMAKNPKQYGLTGVAPDAPVVSDTITTEYAIDLRLVADVTGASLPEIVALNPALLRLSTPRDIPYDLHLPAGTKDSYLTRIKDIPEEDRTTWRFHVVKGGETLDTIASSYHVNSANLASYNEVTPTQPMEPGDELVIPATASSGTPGQQRYTVRHSDTLVTVADRFGITVEQLREWNPSIGAHLTPGRAIYVAEPIHLAPGTRSRHAVRVASGGHSSHGKASDTAHNGSTHAVTKAATHTTLHSSSGSHPASSTVHKAHR